MEWIKFFAMIVSFYSTKCIFGQKMIIFLPVIGLLKTSMRF